MKRSKEQMTPVQAAGYIAGVTYCLIRQHYRGFALALAFAGLALLIVDASLTLSPTMLRLKLGEGAVVGTFLLLASASVWLLFRPKR